jgi:hypothetical protein
MKLKGDFGPFLPVQPLWDWGPVCFWEWLSHRDGGCREEHGSEGNIIYFGSNSVI